MKKKKVKLFTRIIRQMNELQNHKFYAILVFLGVCWLIHQSDKVVVIINALK
ncbi:hypothetical protein [Moraxella sp. Pampa]|uniref:hypothetical protein n=1 Tax=Moraxella sp. Pampa TaxID=3111978 RepID=UPI002B410EDF|nr:hypothetical protein [Moraxella sp. Pampa]